MRHIEWLVLFILGACGTGLASRIRLRRSLYGFPSGSGCAGCDLHDRSGLHETASLKSSHRCTSAPLSDC